MKKAIGLIIFAIIILYNYDKIDENFFQMNLAQNQLNYDETYLFDLNGDGDSEEVKLESYKDKKGDFIVDLYINSKQKETYYDENNISVHIYDFNKIDTNKEICVILGDKIENYKTNLFIYYDENKNDNFIMNGRIINNDDKNGTIKISYSNTDNSSNFNHYSKVIGEEPIVINYLYKRVFHSELIDVDEKEVQVVGASKEKEYRAKEETIVYETNVGDVKAYTLLKGAKIKLVSLYNYNGNECIKVVNEEGRYGWIKIEDKQIFEYIQ